jgi:O-antigen/teichoic acid export membrane protein
MLKFLKRFFDLQSITLLKNSSWVFVSNFIGAVLAFAKAILVARLLGAESYGVFTVIIVFIGTIIEVFNLNLGAALIRFGSGYNTEGRNDKVLALIKASLLASCLVLTVSVLATTLFTLFSYDSFILKPDLEWFSILYAIAAGSVFFNQIGRSALRLFFRFKKNALIQIVLDLIDFSVIVTALLFYPSRLDIFLTAVLITTFINGVIPNIAAWKELKPELPGWTDVSIKSILPDLKPIRSFVFRNSLAKTLQSLTNKGDVLILGLLSANPVQVGLYAVGKKLAYYVLMFTDPLVTSVYPQFCKLREEKNHSAILKMIRRLTLLSAGPAVLFVSLSFLIGEWAVTLIFGKDYTSAGVTFGVLSISAALQASLFWMQPLLQAFDLMSQRVWVFLTGIITGAAAAWLLVPVSGSTGMAWAVVVSQLIMTSFFLTLVFKKVNSGIE